MGKKSAKQVASFLGTSALTRPLFALGAASVLLGAGPAQALDANTLPQNPNVVGGKDSFSQSGNTLNVNQSTNRTVIDWRSFDIGSKAQVNFNQLGTSSIAVNRVNGSTNPTDIEGGLHANGQVWILNPNGVFFGKGARVDAAGIVASTANIDDKAFMSGSNKLQMTGADHGAVENQGNISVGANGLAAFVAPSVRNSGTINATVGRVALAAGTTYTLDLAGDHLVELGLGSVKAVVDNSGKIVNPGGTIALTAKAAGQVVNSVVNVSGVVSASSVTKSGGTITLGGDNVTTTSTAQLSADAGTNGDGGSITSTANVQGNYAGSFSAKGGSESGNGGNVETSGKSVHVDSGITINTLASNGLTGGWTVDPDNLTIGTVDSGDDSSTDQSISAATVESQLGTTNVNLKANNTITVNTAIDTSANTDSNTLNFQDENGGGLTVNLNADITLGAHETLTGQGTVVNVANTGLIQNGIDVALAGGATVNVAAGTYDVGSTGLAINKSGLTLLGASGAEIDVNPGASGQVNAITIGGGTDGVTVSGFDIRGEVNAPYTSYAWGSAISRGVAVLNGATNVTITDNDIRNVRNGILVDGRNTGSITNNVIDNTKSAISVQYTDAGLGNTEGYAMTMTGNSQSTVGNEWGVNFHLNGHQVGSSLVGNAVKIATNATTAVQQALLAFSANNHGMSAQDQGYAQSNRTSVTVSTAGNDANQGSVLSTLGTIQGGINAVVSGGVVNVLNGVYTVLSGTYINITKSLSLIGQSESGVVIDARNASTYGMRVSGPNSNVDLENFTLYGSSIYGLKAENTSNLTLANIDSRGAGKSEFDLNGIIGGTLTNLTADGAPASDATDSTTTAGNGIGITDSQNVTLTGVSTKNNAWGGLALYQTNSPSGYTYQETGITVDGSNHFTEANGIYAQDQSSLNDFGTINLAGQNIQYIGQDATGNADGNYTFFQQTLSGAIALASNSETLSGATVQGYSGSGVGGNNAFYVGNNNGHTMSIQTAVNAAASDATIDVLAGNYSGQVVITKSLTLEGAGSGSTTISAPDVLSHSFTAGGNPYKAVVSIEGGANVSVSGLTVDGRGVGDANNRLLGIGIYDSSATIDGVTVTRVRGGGLSGSLNGVQAGTGIEAYNDGSTPQTVTIKNSVINDFQKNGIAFVGKGINATATGNTITGAGNTTLIAQNGIEVFGVNGTISGANISNNLITGLSYGNSETVASSILLINADNASVSGNTISSAGGTGSYGVVVQGSNNVTISGNTLSNLEEGVDISTADSTTVSGGSISDTQLGIWADPTTTTNLNVTGVSFARNTEQFYGPSGNTSSVLANNTFDRSVTVLDGGQYGNDIFSSIQDGVDTAVSGDTVQVGAGTYKEQVVVSSKNLDIEGAGYGNSIIESPDLLGHSFTSNGGTYKAVVSIENGSNVTLSGFTIDGRGQGNANNRFLGVGILNSNVTLDGLDITGVRDGGVSGTLDGAQAGTGVEAFNDDGAARTVTLENSSIEDFQKNGAAFLGGNLTVTVDNNTITGAGNTTLIAQNGIEFYGTTGTVTGSITNNNISGFSYGNNETVASSIILIGASGTDVENNTVTGTGGTGGYGLAADGSDNLTIADNNFRDLEEGVVLYSGDNINISGGSISGNTVAGLDADPSVTGLSVSGVSFSNNAVQFLGSASNVASIFADNSFDRSVMVSGGDNIFSRVQDGVNEANSGDTVTVGSGTYVEQVTIDKDLDLIGAGAGRTIIEAPSVMATSFTPTGGSAQKAIITIDNGATANISDLTVNGADLGSANAAFDGIGIYNANATVNSVAIEGVRGNPLNGAQNGVGLIAYNTDGSARTVSVTDSTISDFQKNGIAFIGGNLTVDVENNSVTGSGSTGVIAQNGIELFGTTGTITGTVAGNTISGINYTGNNNSATDILLIGASGTTVQGNTITGTGAGDSSNGIYVSGSTGVTLTANTITNTGWGIDVDNGYGTANVTVQNNTVTNNGVGLQVAYQEGDTSVVTARGNNFSGNTSGVELESAAATLDATGNWWGSTSDSTILAGMSGADAGTVNFSNFLASGTDTSSATGFQGDFSHLIVTSLGGGTDRIGEAVSEVSTGGTINVNAGTYTLAGTLNLTKALSLIGAGEGSTVINGSGTGLANYAIRAKANNIALSGFTLDSSAGLGGISVYSQASNTLNNISISNVTINDNASGGTGLAVTNTNGVTLDHVTVDGLGVGGNGIQIADSGNVTLTNAKTQNNEAGLFIVEEGAFAQQTTNISADTTNQFTDAVPVVIADFSAGAPGLGSVNIQGFQYAIGSQSQFGSGPGELSNGQQNAIDQAVALGTTDSFIEGWTGTGVNNNFIVGVSTGGTALSINNAIGAANAGGTINVGTGTYAEAVADAKQLTFNFDDATVNSLALASGAAGSSLNGSLTATGAITSAGAASLNGDFTAASIALNGAATLTGDTSLTASGNVSVASVTGGSHDLSISGASNTLGNVAGVDALTVSGPATLTGTSYAANTAGFGAVTLTGDTTVDANAISIASVTGAGNDLTLDGATSLGNVAGAGALAVNGASTLTGTSYAGTSLNFGGAVTLTGDTSLNASGATSVASVIGGGNDLSITGTSNTLGNVAGVGALAVNGAATLTGVSYVAGSMDFDAVKLANSAALNTSSDNGALVIASVDGSSAGAQTLTLNAGSGNVSLGNVGATTRLGAVSDASKTTLTGSTYNANSFLFGGDVTLTSANTTLNTTQSANAAGDITFQGDLFGAANGGQSLTLIAGTGKGAASANGDITLQNAGTTAVNLNNLTVSGDNFTALTVDLAGDYNSQLTGNQVFAADTLNVKGNATSNVGGDASGHIVAGGDVNIVANGDVSGTINGNNVNLTGDDVNSIVTANNAANIQGNTVEGSYTADTVTLVASNNVNAAVNATDFTLAAQHGSVDGTWTTIDTSGSNVVSLNGQTTVGLADINPNQLVVEGFVLPLGSRIGANGQLILPQGVLLGLLSPGGGKPKMILVHSVQQLGELLAGGYSVIVIDLSNRDSGKPIQLASN